MGKKYPAEEKKIKEHGDNRSQETADTQPRKEEAAMQKEHNKNDVEAAVQKEHNRNYAKIVKPPKTQTIVSSGQESRIYTPTLPYPQRIKRKKEEAHFEKFMDIFKEIYINILLVEALKQMPNYVKFLEGCAHQ